jgi:membrane protein
VTPQATLGQSRPVGWATTSRSARVVRALREMQYATAVAEGTVSTRYEMTGLGATLSVGDALDRLWAVPRVDRFGFVQARVRGVLVLASLGTFTEVSTAAVGLAANAQIHPPLAEVASLVGAVGVDLLIFIACLRLLTSAAVSTRCVLPGAAVAAIGWFALQAIGGIYVSQVVKGSTETYGAFAAVIGLLSWLYLGAQLTLIAAEVNVVLARRLWPRSIAGGLGPADQRALRDAVKAEQTDPQQRIAVTFEPSNETSDANRDDDERLDAVE